MAPETIKLPKELLYIIIEFSDQETRRQWARTCRFLNPLATKLLWETLSIDFGQFNKMRIFSGPRWGMEDFDNTPTPIVDRIPPSGMASKRAANSMKYKGIIYFLVRNAYRASVPLNINKEGNGRGYPYINDKVLAPPGSHIQNLSLDLREGDHFVEQLSVDQCLPLLLSCVPNVKRCAVEGAIYDNTLQELPRLRDLKYLDIRRLDHYYERAFHLRPYSHEYAPIEWEELIINFRHLEPMASLRTLKIGRLVEEEGVSLARAIMGLQLSYLEVSASAISEGWNEFGKHAGRSIIEGSTESPSPLIAFIKEVSRGFLGDNQGHFPPTLKTLKLRDVYHDNYPMERYLLGKAIERSNLEIWSVALTAVIPIDDLQRYLKLQRLYIITLNKSKRIYVAQTRENFSWENEWDPLVTETTCTPFQFDT